MGDLTGPAADYFQIWELIDKTGATLTEIENYWTIERFNAFRAYQDMKNTYKSVWNEYYQQKARKED